MNAYLVLVGLMFSFFIACGGRPIGATFGPGSAPPVTAQSRAKPIQLGGVEYADPTELEPRVIEESLPIPSSDQERVVVREMAFREPAPLPPEIQFTVNPRQAQWNVLRAVRCFMRVGAGAPRDVPVYGSKEHLVAETTRFDLLCVGYGGLARSVRTVIVKEDFLAEVRGRGWLDGAGKVEIGLNEEGRVVFTLTSTGGRLPGSSYFKWTVLWESGKEEVAEFLGTGTLPGRARSLEALNITPRDEWTDYRSPCRFLTTMMGEFAFFWDDSAKWCSGGRYFDIAIVAGDLDV